MRITIIRTIATIFVVIAVAVGSFFAFRGNVAVAPTLSVSLFPSALPALSPSDSPLSIRGSAQGVISDVPFAAQAPFGDWKDPRQQDGCEEASSLMAVSWARHEKFTLTQALLKILDIADYEEKTYGSYHDTDAHDTGERILKGYFHFSNFSVKNKISTDDIKAELYQGHLIIVPVNGQKLHNPYYSGAGPERHMLVIIGYDPARDEFITNDAGTRHGKGYRYKTSVIAGALREYPTGDHLPITDQSRTAMIVVTR